MLIRTERQENGKTRSSRAKGSEQRAAVYFFKYSYIQQRPFRILLHVCTTTKYQVSSESYSKIQHRVIRKVKGVMTACLLKFLHNFKNIENAAKYDATNATDEKLYFIISSFFALL